MEWFLGRYKGKDVELQSFRQFQEFLRILKLAAEAFRNLQSIQKFPSSQYFKLATFSKKCTWTPQIIMIMNELAGVLHVLSKLQKFVGRILCKNSQGSAYHLALSCCCFIVSIVLGDWRFYTAGKSGHIFPLVFFFRLRITSTSTIYQRALKIAKTPLKLIFIQK